VTGMTDRRGMRTRDIEASDFAVVISASVTGHGSFLGPGALNKSEIVAPRDDVAQAQRL
jgi:hypothetical protein